MLTVGKGCYKILKCIYEKICYKKNWSYNRSYRLVFSALNGSLVQIICPILPLPALSGLGSFDCNSLDLKKVLNDFSSAVMRMPLKSRSKNILSVWFKAGLITGRKAVVSTSLNSRDSRGGGGGPINNNEKSNLMKQDLHFQVPRYSERIVTLSFLPHQGQYGISVFFRCHSLEV